MPNRRPIKDSSENDMHDRRHVGDLDMLYRIPLILFKTVISDQRPIRELDMVHRRPKCLIRVLTLFQ